MAPGAGGTALAVRSRSTRRSSRLTRSVMVCSTPWLVIVSPASSRPKPNGSAMMAWSALPWLPRSGAAYASRVLVRSERTHRRSTSSGGMPGPLSATVSSSPSTPTAISGVATPASSAGVERVVDQLLERGAQPVCALAAHALGEFGLGRELEVARERKGDAPLDQRGHGRTDSCLAPTALPGRCFAAIAHVARSRLAMRARTQSTSSPLIQRLVAGPIWIGGGYLPCRIPR